MKPKGADLMKKNKYMRYFKSYIILPIIGAVVAAVGFILHRYAWDLWILGRPLMVLGALIIGVFFLVRIDDKHYSERVELLFDNMPNDPDRKPDHIFNGYFFEDTKFVKLDKSGSPRSEKAIRTYLCLDNTLKVIIGCANVELESFEAKTYVFPKVTAHLTESEITVDKRTRKLAALTLTSDGGSISFPVKSNDIEVDELIEQINKKYK